MESASVKCFQGHCKCLIYSEGQPVVSAACAVTGGLAMHAVSTCQGPINRADERWMAPLLTFLEEVQERLRHPTLDPAMDLVTRADGFIRLLKEAKNT